MTVFSYKSTIFKPKDPISALSHFIGCVLSVLLMPVLLIKAALCGASLINLVSFSIYMLSMIGLYAASASYHSFNIGPKANIFLKKLDHCSIFLLIAGSYTPVCTITLAGKTGTILLAVIWSIALAGIIFKLCWVTCPKWVSSVMYISMGWAALSVLPAIYRQMPTTGFIFLVLGGILYTIGGVIYAIKPKMFKNVENTGFGNHELFHLFVLAGSVCHFIMMILALAI